MTSFIRSTRQETACISEESSCISICFFFTVKCGKRVDRVYQSSGRLTELESLKWKQNFYCLNNVTVFCCLPSSNESCSPKPSSAERSSYKTKKRERFYFLVWSFLISDHFNRANSRSKFTSEFCLSPGSRAHTHTPFHNRLYLLAFAHEHVKRLKRALRIMYLIKLAYWAILIVRISSILSTVKTLWQRMQRSPALYETQPNGVSPCFLTYDPQMRSMSCHVKFCFIYTQKILPTGLSNFSVY